MPASDTIQTNILDYFPARIRTALETYAAETEMPVEFVLEMAIAGFLDVDSMTFANCRTDSPGQLREQNAILKAKLKAAGLSDDE
jgi:hypothetical protein